MDSCLIENFIGQLSDREFHWTAVLIYSVKREFQPSDREFHWTFVLVYTCMSKENFIGHLSWYVVSKENFIGHLSLYIVSNENFIGQLSDREFHWTAVLI